MALEPITDHAAEAKTRLPGYQREAPTWNALLRAQLAPADALETAMEALLGERWISTASGLQLDLAGTILNVSRLGRGDEDYRVAIAGEAERLGQSGTIEVLVGTYLRTWAALDGITVELVQLQDGDGLNATVQVCALVNQDLELADGTTYFALLDDESATAGDATDGGLADGETDGTAGDFAGALWDGVTLTAVNAEGIIAAMERAKAAGVQLILSYVDTTMDNGALTLCEESEVDVDGNGPISTTEGLGTLDDSTGGALATLLE